MTLPSRILITVTTVLLAATTALGRDAGNLAVNSAISGGESVRQQDFSFDGYKNYWSRDAWRWNAARGLFLQSQQTPEAALWAMEEEIGNQLMLEELWVQRGFLQRLAGRDYILLDRPSAAEFQAATAANLLVAVTDQDELGKALIAKLPEAWQFRRNRAFYLEDGEGAVYVLACQTPEELERLKAAALDTLAVLEQYDFHRGLAGIVSNYLHITPGIGHNPFELVQLARSLGCDWLTVNGYNDWMMAGPVNRALRDVQDPFLFISGQSVTDGAMYGLERYPDVQDNTIEQCLDWAQEKGGYYFANLSAAEGEHASRFQGFLITGADDQKRVEELDAAFLARAGDIDHAAPPTMVAFLDKGTELTQASLFEAITGKHAVAVYPEGVIVGPKAFRTAMQFLLLEGAVLSDRIGGPVQVDAKIENGKLTIDLQNQSNHPLEGGLFSTAGPEIRFESYGDERQLLSVVDLKPGERASLPAIPLNFTAAAGGHNNLVGISGTVKRADGGAAAKATPVWALASIKLPPAVTFNTLRYDAPGTVTYPVSLWNSSTAPSLEFAFVVRRKDTGVEAHRTERSVEAGPWRETRQEVSFDIAAGDYIVEASALGVTATGQLAVREAPGEVAVHEEDLDGDGAPEVIMENDTVRVAVLMEGGRVIQYILKETGENVFFQLWPETPPLHGTVGGTRSFYPYGGLEEFIGYPYIGGHIVYHYEVLQSSGTRGRVHVWANIHGSKISKIYTLYAGGPVLEATYAFSDMTPTIQTIGINPLFQLGPSTGPEDHYYFPEGELVETRPELGRYYGRACFPKEGWAAGQDPDAKVSLVIGYPVNDAVYLHLWNNHPDNTPTPYFYTELQPWLQFHHGTTTYFSYYVLGSTEDWKMLLETFRNAGLVTNRINPAPWDY